MRFSLHLHFISGEENEHFLTSRCHGFDGFFPGGVDVLFDQLDYLVIDLVLGKKATAGIRSFPFDRFG